MALVNYSLPFVAPAPATPYLGGLPGFNTAPAVNSLFYPPPPPAPSRRTATTSRRPPLSNDPYRNQQTSRQHNYFNDNNGNYRNVPPPPMPVTSGPQYLPAPASKQQPYPPNPNSRQQNYPPNPASRQQNYPPNPASRQQNYPLNPAPKQQNYPSNPAPRQQNYPPNPAPKKQDHPPNPAPKQQDYPPNPAPRQQAYPSNPAPKQQNNPQNHPSLKQQPYPDNPASKQQAYPGKAAGYEEIDEQVSPGAKTSLHAVLDYDDDFDDYSYDDEDVEELPPEYRHSPLPAVTPIQGPISLRNNSVPVVPLYSHSVVSNGTLVQIPILWTALSVALGLEIRGEIVRGVPCIKRFHQLFCPTAGNSYPVDRIESFIDENKALMKRMYGDFQMSTEYGPPARDRTVKREAPGDGRRRESPAAGAPDTFQPPEPGADAGGRESYFSKLRQTRQSFRSNQSSESGRVDACESKIEITTPYWASNSAGKIRAIVNTQHFEQAIHQEVCSSKTQTKRCSGDCGCEQKYKWHRLLAYDPDNDCKGIFMDWFLFPSCCVCRCNPLFPSN